MVADTMRRGENQSLRESRDLIGSIETLLLDSFADTKPLHNSYFPLGYHNGMPDNS